MPYDGERAEYETLRRIVLQERVTKLLEKYSIRTPTDGDTRPEAPWEPSRPSAWLPNYIIAIDGGMAPIPHEKGYPGAESCFLTVAAVMLDFKKMRELDQQRPADPRELRKTQRVGSIEAVIPGYNMVLEGEATTADSLRRVYYQELDAIKLMGKGETLLETYEALLTLRGAASPGVTREPTCPSDKCRALEPPTKFTPTPGIQVCGVCGYNIYSTDALRFHERMSEERSNQDIYSEVRQTLEILSLVNVLRSMERMGTLNVLADIVFVLDGPLAVFGQPAWLGQATKLELQRLNKLIRKASGSDLFLLGVEKTGNFKEHLERLDENGLGHQDQVPAGSVCLLDNDYIRANIRPGSDTRPYGDQTYFGRKFFVKTANGARIVALTPFLREGDDQTATARRDQFPRLDDALNLISHAVCSRYQDSILPLVAANAEAAIPMEAGQRILEELARKHMTSAPQSP